MIIPRVILAPLVGGIIGYITNDLAIRMLFRPRKAMYIGRFHIPMTPGLIPSQQGRIAQSIGEVVSQQLLNEETLRQTLLSQKTLDTLREKITGFLRSFSQDERTVYEIFRQPAIRDRVNPSGESMRKKLAEALSAKIVEARLGHEIVDSIIGNRMDFITQNKLFSMLIDGNTKEAIRDKLAEKVNELIADRAPDAAAALVNRYRGGCATCTRNTRIGRSRSPAACWSCTPACWATTWAGSCRRSTSKRSWWTRSTPWTRRRSNGRPSTS